MGVYAKGKRMVRRVRMRGLFAGFATLLLISACVSQVQVGEAIHAVNKEFQVEYEGILDKYGIRVYKVSQVRAFVALHAALARLGMRVADQDPLAGTLTAIAPAPRPLNAAEWQSAAEADMPLMRKTACPIVGSIACQQIRFEPEGLNIIINATVLTVAAGTEISMTARMRQIAEPKSGMPRREYPPPTAVRMALDKMWGQFERELADQEKRP
jgi:hypothetical protein